MTITPENDVSDKLNTSGSGSANSYDDSDKTSKTVVSWLTNAVNAVMDGTNKSLEPTSENVGPAPKSPHELLERIKDDYVINNYLWTGDIHKAAFAEDCRFTDPTLSFTGRETFVSNVQNLRPIVDRCLGSDGKCKSNLLDISLNAEKEYVQTRWNMYGELKALPWKPMINVIGRTKFWYQNVAGSDTNGFCVYFYDEEWEVPAYEALLQLITPGRY